MLRVIFLILLSVNLLFLAWQAWLLPEAEPDTVLVAPPAERTLLRAESDHRPVRHEPIGDAAVTPSDPDWSPEGCLGLGPFETVAGAEVFAAELGLISPQLRMEPVSEVIAWWVLLPPERVLDPEAMLQRLDAAGAGDFFLIPSGEAVGGVSLGLFTAPERAERRRQRVRTMGFDPVIRERREESEQHWLLLPLGFPLPDGAAEAARLEAVICPESPESLVTQELEPLE